MDRVMCCGWLQVMCAMMLMGITGCLAETQYASFDTSLNCDQTYVVSKDSKVIVTGQRSSSGGSSSSVNKCDLLFRAEGREERLCFEINKLAFKNSNLELNYFNSLDPTDIQPTKTFKSSEAFRAPQEICSEDRYASLQLETTSNSASIRDVELEIVVHNMGGNTRVGNMDRDCGTTYDLDNSVISVLNRPSDGGTNATNPCQLWFQYTGLNPNYTLCLRYLRNKENCGYNLRVFDGTARDFTPAHTYSCQNDKPQVWCSNKKAFYLEMMRDDVNANEPASMFSIEIKDGIKGQVEFPTPEPSSGFPIWAIVVIAVVAVLIVVLIIVCIVKKSKGYSVPRDQHEAHKI